LSVLLCVCAAALQLGGGLLLLLICAWLAELNDEAVLARLAIGRTVPLPPAFGWGVDWWMASDQRRQRTPWWIQG